LKYCSTSRQKSGQPFVNIHAVTTPDSLQTSDTRTRQPGLPTHTGLRRRKLQRLFCYLEPYKLFAFGVYTVLLRLYCSTCGFTIHHHRPKMRMFSSKPTKTNLELTTQVLHSIIRPAGQWETNRCNGAAFQRRLHDEDDDAYHSITPQCQSRTSCRNGGGAKDGVHRR
jgi:hypothetical protein